MAVSHYLHSAHTFLLALIVVRGQEGTPIHNTTTSYPSDSLPRTSKTTSMNTPSRIPLYLIGMLPMTGEWPGGIALMPAVNMALEDLNKRRDVLPGYELVMLMNDTKGDIGASINNLFAHLYSPPTKIAVFGLTYSTVAEPIVKAAYSWNVNVVSSMASSPVLSNKAEFPNFLRVQSPDNLINPAKITIMKRYNWRQVATIHEPAQVFSKGIDDLRLRLAVENMTLISSHILSEKKPTLQIQSLQQEDARIIIVAAYENKMVSLMCEAYKAGMYGRRYVWFLPDWYSKNWPERSFSHIDCTPEQIYAVIRPSAIFLTFQTGINNQRETRGVAGMTPPEFMKRYLKITDNNLYTGVDETAISYDTLWAIALGLNKTVADLHRSGKGLKDFTYSNKEIAELILKNIWEQKFLGVTGEVFFNENGDVPRDVQISQYRGTKKHVVGIYSQKDDVVNMYDDVGLAWKGGVPKDATTFRTVRVFVSGTVYYSVCCCASIGMVVAAAFLVFNIYYRKLRIIKMSSPVMNNVILVGCIVVYLTVFLQELSADNVALLCKLRTVTIMVGFSLSFGALFAKTWRVYIIFTNTTKRVVLRDYQLLLIVGVLVLIDLTAFVLRQTLDTPTVVTMVLEKEILNNGDLVVEKEILACYSDYSLYFEASVIVYKGLLLIFGAFLAFQTRKVNIPALNDSQYIGMCVYNVTILSILGVVLVFALQNQVLLSYTLVSAFIIFATTIVQLTIFVPKVLKVYNARNRVEEGEDSTETATSFAVANKPGTTVDKSSELDTTKKELQEAKQGQQELKSELGITMKELHEAKEGQLELKQGLEITKKELHEARKGQQELEQELEITKKELHEARKGQQELEQELEITKKELHEVREGQQELIQELEATRK